MRMLFLLAVAAATIGPPFTQNGPQHQHAAPEQLGRVHFETSCEPSVRGAFDRAVALLHSFSFSDARQAFEEVAAKDPACAMAHWGIAMSQWGNPFAGLRPSSSLIAGLAAVRRAESTGAPTPRERGYIAAVATLYRDFETVDQRARVLAYESAMENVHRDHPADSEAAIFYALAVNQAALPTDKTYARQLKAAAILEKLFASAPEHPGLAHYIIHAYDNPSLAARALDAARRYAKIAPSAPHALHMPSHTFTRVGYWQESIDTNIASARSALRDGVFGEALHAMDYQMYAYLQSGQDAAARRVADEAPEVVKRLDVNALGGAAPGVAGLYAAAAIPARYAMERGAWQEAVRLRVTPTAFPYVDALTHFARAIGFARSGQPGPARDEIANLGAFAEKLEAMKDAYWTGQVRIQQQVASAWLAFAEGREAQALDMLRKAADAEDATDKSAVSPGPLAPARELLGEMLLAAKRPADALKEFEATIQKEPRRFRATYYAATAASLAGERELARKRFAELLDICASADTPGRSELQQARKFVTP